MEAVYAAGAVALFYLGLVVGWRMRDGRGPLPTMVARPFNGRRDK